MAIVRPYEAKDKENVREVCLATGPKDAYEPKKRVFLTLCFSEYYTENEPDNCFVLADDADNAVGYILCAENYGRYAQVFRRDYLPRVRKLGFFLGIGAWVNTGGDYVEIISPMKGSPAEAAGLQAQDLVIAINGEDMTGIPGDLVLKRILGPAGETIVLTIRRGEETFDVPITRALIQIPVVDYEMREDGIGYVALYTFNELATEKLRAALKDLLAQKPKGIVFDLRGNGGGYLVTAVEVTSEFLKDGVVLYEEYGDGTREPYPVEKGGRATEIPLVVLIDEGSASASEITAGALQDYGRAKLVGVTSYGKGSVQNWIPLRTEAGGVRITIARWLTPNGNHIDGIGLTPDLVVEFTEEDLEAKRDPQLDAAVELLLDAQP